MEGQWVIASFNCVISAAALKFLQPYDVCATANKSPEPTATEQQ